MVYCYYIVCEKEHFAQEIRVDQYVTSYRYLKDDRYIFESLTTIAWCLSCQRGVEAEVLPPVDVIETALRDNVAGNNSEIQRWLDKPVEDKLVHETLNNSDSLKIKLDWRLARQSSPRCLDCGSTDVNFGAEIPDSGRYFIHPKCGGKCNLYVEKESDIFSESSYGEPYSYLSTEGEHLTSYIERIPHSRLDNLRQLGPKLTTLLSRLQTVRNIGDYVVYRPSLWGEIIFTLITSRPYEYIVYVWLSPDSQQSYQKSKATHDYVELLPVGSEAFFAPNAQEKVIADMRCENIYVRIVKSLMKDTYHGINFPSTILTRDQVFHIFQDILDLITQPDNE